LNIKIGLAAIGLAVLLSPRTLAAQDSGGREVSLPAGLLTEALQQLAEQRGILLLFDPALLKNLQAPALHGRYSTQMALEQLLLDSGWHALKQPDGSYQLIALNRENSLPLAAVEIRSSLVEFSYGGAAVMTSEYIEAQPSGNGDIGSLLITHPAVRHDDARRSSKRPGEISPAEISIHGAPFY